MRVQSEPSRPHARRPVQRLHPQDGEGLTVHRRDRHGAFLCGRSHEMAQDVPLSGNVYQQMQRKVTWKLDQFHTITQK